VARTVKRARKRPTMKGRGPARRNSGGMSTLTAVGPKQFVAYFRVSTQRQGRSGLGLEAQQKMVRDYVALVGGTIVAEFVEVESGKSAKNRPQLQKALALARKRGARATLIVAKLDRLARQVSFVSQLLDTPGVEFKAADFPEANRMMIQILAVVAEYEREQISRRTREALAARRRRGFELGNVANLKVGGLATAQHNRAEACAEAERMRPAIDAARAAGYRSLRELAAALNAKGYRREGGTPYHAKTVGRIIERLAHPRTTDGAPRGEAPRR